MAEYIFNKIISVGKGDKISILPMVCPKEGSFIGYKVGHDYCHKLTPCIITLEIPADAKRSSACGRKCRCDKAKVLDITLFIEDGGQKREHAMSFYDHFFKYHIGKEVSVPNFDENRWHECAPGIHFFMTKEEAINYYYNCTWYPEARQYIHC